MLITGSNKDFHAIWDCNSQEYSVYKDNKFLLKLYRFDLVKNYIN